MTMNIKRWLFEYFDVPDYNSPIKETRVLYDFDVKEDITAYELYLIKTKPYICIGKYSEREKEFKKVDDWYNNLSENAKRHLKKVKKEVVVGYKGCE